ncbi:hypothetical protein [Demequina salsinemoris]|uniref:hypothetical protein n=1 Tax=Demequina salsinemoris TaxID=577470 RepID=UPI000784B58A|nr:hypothetical protein [Demequina salsinemoris]
MIADVLFDLGFGSLLAWWGARDARARIRRLRGEGILVGAVRGVYADLGRFGREWLSSDWRVSPGRVRTGSTTIEADSVDAETRSGETGDFMLPPGMDTIVLTVRGPGPLVEIAMPSESEAWFREAVARREAEPV